MRKAKIGLIGCGGMARGSHRRGRGVRGKGKNVPRIGIVRFPQAPMLPLTLLMPLCVWASKGDIAMFGVVFAVALIPFAQQEIEGENKMQPTLVSFQGTCHGTRTFETDFWRELKIGWTRFDFLWSRIEPERNIGFPPWKNGWTTSIYQLQR